MGVRETRAKDCTWFSANVEPWLSSPVDATDFTDRNTDVVAV